MGSGKEIFLKVVFKNFDVFAGPLIGLVYPLYATIRAIETRSREDDRQWLAYWVIYSMITLFESTFEKVIQWVPLWAYAKLILISWLVVPYFNGATYVYDHFLRRIFLNSQQTVNIWYVPRKVTFNEPDDILTAAKQY